MTQCRAGSSCEGGFGRLGYQGLVDRRKGSVRGPSHRRDEERGPVLKGVISANDAHREAQDHDRRDDYDEGSRGSGGCHMI